LQLYAAQHAAMRLSELRAAEFNRTQERAELFSVCREFRALASGAHSSSSHAEKFEGTMLVMTTEDDTIAALASADTTLPTPPPLPEPIAEPEVLQVRLGGNPGVRVRADAALIQHVRVTGQDASDHRAVPRAVLSEVAELLEQGIRASGAEETLTALERLHAVRELLAPWL
jgi:hypothetical protein